MSDVDTMRGLREAFKAKEDVFAHKRWATEEEAEILYTLVKQNNIGRVVEVGTANGWTAAWFALAGAQVYTFDMVDRPKMYLDSLFPFPELASRIHFQEIPSPQCLVSVFPYMGVTLYFVDGDHTFAGAKRDVDAVMAIAKTGDWVAQHDATGEVGSRRVWQQTVALELGEYKLYETRNGVGVVRLT